MVVVIAVAVVGHSLTVRSLCRCLGPPLGQGAEQGYYLSKASARADTRDSE